MIAGLLAPVALVVNCGQVIRHDADRFFGIDLNYIRDRDSNRPGARPLDQALREMGVRWLRFPGGEKSNYHLWSEPPYAKPAPKSLGWYATPKGDRMDFDEYMRHVRAVGAEPYVVVGFESKERTGLTQDQWIESAAAWVRYAKAKHYEVRYWEVGNENWGKRSISPAAMARIVAEFSKAMKAADPSILIGASGENDRYWREFLPIASPAIDFLTVSQYTGWAWGNYEHFLSDPELIDTAKQAVDAIGRYARPEDRPRLRVIAAEVNAKDYSDHGWPDSNDLGHALVTFATLGRLAESPTVKAAMVWTTRWMDDREAPDSEFFALGPHNDLTPSGQAIRAWGGFVKPVLVRAESGDPSVDIFAARAMDARAMTVWVLNRHEASCSIQLRIDGLSFRSVHAVRYAGSSPEDRTPVWVQLPEARLSGHAPLDDNLPPLSITVFSFDHNEGDPR